MEQIKYFCDWCKKEQENKDVMRNIEFLIITDKICLTCCKEIARVRRIIKRKGIKK